MAKIRSIRSKQIAKTGGALTAVALNDIVNVTFGGVKAKVIGVQISATANIDANGEKAHLQISTRSSMSLATDDREVIADVMMEKSMTTSGVYQDEVQKVVMFPSGYGMPIDVDEKVYLHGQGTEGLNYDIAASIFYVLEDENA